MRPVVPPQGFRHAVDLLLKNGARKSPVDADQLARDLLALSDDMKAPPEFSPWVVSEYERVLQRPAPALLDQIGQNSPREPERRDLFLIYVPEDRLPIAAPLAVELTKRRISVAFSGYEIESAPELESVLAYGLEVNKAGAVLATADFRRRQLPEPSPSPRVKVLAELVRPTAQAEDLVIWLSKIHTIDSGRKG
jgi:hypothetical protein